MQATRREDDHHLRRNDNEREEQSGEREVHYVSDVFEVESKIRKISIPGTSRSTSSDFDLETGRWCRKPRQERVCRIYGTVGDEEHNKNNFARTYFLARSRPEGPNQFIFKTLNPLVKQFLRGFIFPHLLLLYIFHFYAGFKGFSGLKIGQNEDFIVIKEVS